MTSSTPHPDHPLVGQTIAGKYKVTRLLGEGGMGCVYQGEQLLGTTVRNVAVKTLHKHLSHDASIQARFKREVGTVAALEHPNTIQVFDFGEMADGTLYIVMEFVQGRSVADILEKDGPMAPARVSNILRQVCGSLEEAHGHGIVHRDLKPENVVLTERAGQKDWVEVLDFGIAKRSTEHDPNEAKLTQQGMVLGTPPYMSPEQFTGQPIDVRSDIYSLGVMAYEMLSGRLPWQANTAWEWATKHMTEPPTPLERQPLGPGVPENMRNAIARALSKDRDARFKSAREFYEACAEGPGPVSLSPQAPQVSGVGGAGQPQLAASAAGPNSLGQRAKTEVGAPMMQPAPHAPAIGAPVVAAPNVPRAQPSGPKQNLGLLLGLGGFALVLFVGAGIFALRKPSKVSPVVAAELVAPPATSPDAAANAPSHADDPTVVTVAPSLSNGARTAEVAPNAAGAGKKPNIPTPVPTSTTPTPIPRPEPPKTEPADCTHARAAKRQNLPAKVIQTLEAKCRAAGGTP